MNQKLLTILLLVVIACFLLGEASADMFSEPNKMAADLIQNTRIHPATIKTSESDASLSKSENEYLRSRLVTDIINHYDKNKLAIGQVCLSRGDFENKETSGFELTSFPPSTEIRYVGEGEKYFGLAAFCYTGKELESKIKENGQGVINPEWAKDCQCAAANNEDLCCIIALKTPKRSDTEHSIEKSIAALIYVSLFSVPAIIIALVLLWLIIKLVREKLAKKPTLLKIVIIILIVFWLLVVVFFIIPNTTSLIRCC